MCYEDLEFIDEKCPQCGSKAIHVASSPTDNRGLGKCRDCGCMWVVDDDSDWRDVIL